MLKWAIGGTTSLAVDSRHDVGEHHAAKLVVAGPRIVAEPIKLHDARAADRLAGVQLQMHGLHSRLDVQPVVRQTLDRRAPLSRPANGRDHAAAGPLQIEEWTGARGRPAAVGGKRDRLALGTDRPQRQPIVDSARAADQPVQRGLAGCFTVTSTARSFSRIGVSFSPLLVK